MKEEKSGPLILLFSPREKIRSILTAGFLQSGYRFIEANTSYIAGVKANQYLPDLIIADITQNNIKDFLFLSRLERSTRTKDIFVLISVTKEVRKALDNIRKEVGAVVDENEKKRVHIIEYPYNFNELINKIGSILSEKTHELPEGTKKPLESSKILGERLLDNKIPILDKLRIIEGTIEKQWAFPFTVVRSLEIIGSEKSCYNELAKCIEADLAAASTILSISNKVHYASRYGRITSVHDAVVRIGFIDTRNILAGLALIDVSPEVYLQYGFKRTEFWMHSLATAIIAEKLCRNTKIKRPEMAFIAGLIHDLGKIPLDINFTDIFAKLLEETTNTISSFYETEMKLMGFSHTGLGHFFTTNWDFPSPITMSVLNHHDPDKIINTKIQLDRAIQESVYVANIFSKALGFGHSCDEVLSAIPVKILKELGIPEGPKNPFLKHVFKTLNLYYEYLEISTEDVALDEPQRNTKDIRIFVVASKESIFHPLILGLKSNGFPVIITKELPEMEDGKSAVALFIPDKDSPLDITLTADDSEQEEDDTSILKIFLLDGVETEEPRKDLIKSNILMMNSNHIDLRLVLQIIEDYYYAKTM